MGEPWPLVPLGEVLIKSSETTPIHPDRTYSEVTVRMWGNGVILRRVATGAEIAADRRAVVHAGEFILSRIDARNGAFGIVPASLNGAVVSNDFPSFRPVEDRLATTYLGWLSKTAGFVDLCRRASEGTTNRVRLKEELFLRMPIPLPALEEQQRIVARVEAIAEKVEEVQRLRREAAEEARALMPAALTSVIGGLGNDVAIGEVCTVIDPNPSHRYPAYVPEGVPIVSSSEFEGEDAINWQYAKRVPESFYAETLGRFSIGAGDVVFSRKGKLGYARPVPDGVSLAMTHTLCVIKPDRAKLDPRYLLQYARSSEFLGQLSRTMNPNTGVPTLGLGVIRDTSIPLPSLDRQRSACDALDVIRSAHRELWGAQGESQRELDAVLPSVLDRAFRGEL